MKLRELDGIASCSNHSERFHRVFEKSVLDIRNLTGRIAKVTEMLKRKAHGYESRGWNSAKAILQQLAAKVKSWKVATCQPKGFSCGWSEVYAARFCGDNYPCLYTLICCPEPVFPKLNLIPDRKSDRLTVRTASAPGPWNFCDQRD
jgi:hypothetical protein